MIEQLDADFVQPITEGLFAGPLKIVAFPIDYASWILLLMVNLEWLVSEMVNQDESKISRKACWQNLPQAIQIPSPCW